MAAPPRPTPRDQRTHRGTPADTGAAQAAKGVTSGNNSRPAWVGPEVSPKIDRLPQVEGGDVLAKHTDGVDQAVREPIRHRVRGRGSIDPQVIGQDAQAFDDLAELDGFGTGDAPSAWGYVPRAR